MWGQKTYLIYVFWLVELVTQNVELFDDILILCLGVPVDLNFQISQIFESVSNKSWSISAPTQQTLNDMVVLKTEDGL